MPQQISSSSKNKDVTDNTYIAAIAYLGILCFVPLFLKRDSKFAQAHAKQGLVLFIAEIVGVLFYWIPFFGQLLLLAFVIISAYGIVQALKGERWEIPIIGKYADNLNI